MISLMLEKVVTAIVVRPPMQYYHSDIDFECDMCSLTCSMMSSGRLDTAALASAFLTVVMLGKNCIPSLFVRD